MVDAALEVAGIQKFSRRLRLGLRLSVAVAIFTWFALLVSTTLFGNDFLFTYEDGVMEMIRGTPTDHRTLDLLWLVRIALIVALFNQFDRLLGLYCRPELFTLRTTGRLRTISWLIVTCGILNFFAISVDVADYRISTFRAYLSFPLDGSTFPLLIGLGLLVATRVMRVACEIAEEAELTV